MPTVTVGTFNLNNLFSRFNFTADLADAQVVETRGTTRFTFEAGAVTERTYKGHVVKPKPHPRVMRRWSRWRVQCRKNR